MATVVQTEFGTWRVTVRRKGTKTLTKTFKRKTDADNWATQTEADINKGEHRPEAKGAGLSFAELWKAFCADDVDGLPSQSATQQKVMPGKVKFWLDAFGYVLLRELTPELIDDAVEQLKQKRIISTAGNDHGQISPSTVRKYLSDLGTVFKYAVTKRFIRETPMRQVHGKPEANDERVRILTDDERIRLLAACDISQTPELPVTVRLALNTGLRKSELFGLTQDRVNITDRAKRYQADGLPFVIPPRHILVEITKNGHPRLMPLNDEAADALASWMRTQPIDAKALVFPSRETPRKPLDIDRPWETALRRAEITDFRWHDMRHCFASELIMSGASVAQVAKLTGHRDLKSLMRYSHLSPEHSHELVARISRKEVKA
jgi:integrase